MITSFCKLEIYTAGKFCDVKIFKQCCLHIGFLTGPFMGWANRLSGRPNGPNELEMGNKIIKDEC